MLFAICAHKISKSSEHYLQYLHFWKNLTNDQKFILVETFKTVTFSPKPSSSSFNTEFLYLTMTQQKEEDRAVSEPIVVTDQSFDLIVAKNRLVVVDFWAAWCWPCKQLSPIIDELSLEFSKQVLFGKLNVDDSPQVPSRFHIRSIPTIMIFKGGIPADQIVGLMPKSAIRKRITSNL